MTQKLIRLGDKWHLAVRQADFVFTGSEIETLTPEGRTTRILRVQEDGRFKVAGWVDEKGALICLVGCQDQVADLPGAVDAPTIVPVAGSVWVIYQDLGYEGYGEPDGVYTTKELAEAAIASVQKGSDDWVFLEMDLRGRLEDIKPRQNAQVAA